MYGCPDSGKLGDGKAGIRKMEYRNAKKMKINLRRM
jgi:hypothetical protein